MNPQPDLVTWAAAFAGLFSLVSLVLGWLLNHVFSELHALKRADEVLAEKVGNLAASVIDRPTFDRHIDREEAVAAAARMEVKLALDAMRSDIAALLREIQQTRLQLVTAIAGRENKGDT